MFLGAGMPGRYSFTDAAIDAAAQGLDMRRRNKPVQLLWIEETPVLPIFAFVVLIFGDFGQIRCALKIA